jgi:hypothetical protein
MSPAQMSPAQMSPAQVSPAQMSPARTSPWRRIGILAVLTATAVLISACGQGTGTFAASHAPTGPKTILVSLGGYELPGYSALSGSNAFSDSEPGPDWAQLFYSRALSHRSTLYDLSSSTGPYVEDLLSGEVGTALGLHPNLVAVWIGMPDLLDGMSSTTFGQDLETLLGELDRAHAEVLVANLLPIYRFPGYAMCESQPTTCGLTSELPPTAELQAGVSGYDQAMSAAASGGRATVVNLTGVFGDQLGSSGSKPGPSALIDEAGLGLTAAGEQLVASAFESAYSAAHRAG